MENSTPNRVPAGILTGGQFAATAHGEPALSLIPAPVDGPDFDYDFEADRGPGLRKELEALPGIYMRAAINASQVTDLLRDSYSVYFANGEAPQSRADAVRNLEDALSHLPRDQRERQIELIRFAVHEEMKHWADRGHVLNPEHRYELLIDESDYRDEDDLLENGQEENRERWEILANTAAFHAVAADNSLQQTSTVA